MYYIYILYSPSSDIYYVGYSSDYVKRFHDHNYQDHFNTFTSKHRPWQLKAIFQCGDLKNQAIQLERFIKKQKSRTFIEKMLTAEKFDGVLAQLVRVPQLRD